MGEAKDLVVTVVAALSFLLHTMYVVQKLCFQQKFSCYQWSFLEIFWGRYIELQSILGRSSCVLWYEGLSCREGIENHLLNLYLCDSGNCSGDMKGQLVESGRLTLD